MERDHSNEDLLLPPLIVIENTNVLIVDRSGIFGQFSIIFPFLYNLTIPTEMCIKSAPYLQ